MKWFIIFVVTIIISVWIGKIQNKKKVEEKLGKKLANWEYEKYIRDEKRAQRREETKKIEATPEAIEARRKEQEAREVRKREIAEYIQNLENGKYPYAPLRFTASEKLYYKVIGTSWQDADPTPPWEFRKLKK